MSKKKLTKEQRAQREVGLSTAIVAGLVATVEAQAKRWALVARDLRKGLSATAIKRAERLAHKIADEKPPGYVKAMEAMDEYDEVCARLRISKRDQDKLWGAICQFCMFQLGASDGPFYRAARYFGIAVPPELRSLAEDDLRNALTGDAKQIEVVAAPRRRTPGCNCPNCRPRSAEELN
jgi:hypothetical protein